ncbi:MAG TPA: hypothetical protein DDZ68_15650 [Parvularcula sp.]|nr:hypothetical protein [Parvularcula sp.]
MGCEPVPQVGSAGYFIDIGVKHPSWPYGFILAVECDGASYHSCRSARDRDRLRQEVLERLGWKFHRIWSTDWFNDPQKEAERLRLAIEQRLAELLSDREKYIPPQSTSAFTSSPSISPVNEAEPEGTAANSGVQHADREDKSLEIAKSQSNDLAARSYIEIGDQVRVRYLSGDEATVLLTISNNRNDPNNGIVSAHEPIARAILGAEAGEEVEILIGRNVRRALIEKIIKPQAA